MTLGVTWAGSHLPTSSSGRIRIKMPKNGLGQTLGHGLGQTCQTTFLPNHHAKYEPLFRLGTLHSQWMTWLLPPPPPPPQKKWVNWPHLFLWACHFIIFKLLLGCSCNSQGWMKAPHCMSFIQIE